MKIIRYTIAAALVALPLLTTGMQAQAATADQYSARGHGRHPMMTNRPSREIYHRGHHRHHRHHRY